MRTEKKMKKYSVKPSGFWYSFGQLRDDRLTALCSGVKILGSELEGYPSGQRDQTVNLTALPSKVRILLPPPAIPRSDEVSVQRRVLGLAGVAQW